MLVSHVPLLPLRSMGFSGIMIAVNMQPRCHLVIFILDTWGVEGRIHPRPLERVR